MNSINVKCGSPEWSILCAQKIIFIVDRIAVVTNKCHRDVNKADKCV